MTINQIQDELIDEFSFFEDWMEKYEYIIDLGKELPAMEKENQTEENLIKGCQSQVWLHAEENEGNIHFSADSDAIITKGIIAVLLRSVNGKSAKEIAESPLYFVEKIGLKEHLSMTRANGLVSMINKISEIAKKYA
ncbi:MAG: SufE family protein [Flavobacteriales bacterium]|jgi:cysteine desulfuration protein SufE|nr:SufE family protein [Flavobacteriales bacterium]